MAITLRDETRKRLLASIQQFFREDLDEEVGDLRAQLVLDFCLAEIGPTIYNQAVADSQAFLQGKLDDLEASCWEQEFAYWARKR